MPTASRRRNAVQHAAAAVVFGLLAVSGAVAATERLYGLAVPTLLCGAAGASGAAILAVRLWRGPDRAVQRRVRVAMACCAVPVLVSGWALAPEGVDRGFVVWVTVVLACVLALFASFSGERGRVSR